MKEGEKRKRPARLFYVHASSPKPGSTTLFLRDLYDPQCHNEQHLTLAEVRRLIRALRATLDAPKGRTG